MQHRSLIVGHPVHSGGRVALLLAGLGLSTVYLVALLVKPDPRGYGTHQQLGLPECSFQMLLARPCPGCGMTTSFACFVRGSWSDAFHANPAGLLLALTCAVLIPWCWWSAWCGRLWLVTEPWITAAVLAAAWGTATMLVWVMRWW